MRILRKQVTSEKALRNAVFKVEVEKLRNFLEWLGTHNSMQYVNIYTLTENWMNKVVMIRIPSLFMEYLGLIFWPWSFSFPAEGISEQTL